MRRFISPDDTSYLDPKSVNGCNLYCYCNNDPVNFVDPSGCEPLTATISVGLILLYAFVSLSLIAVTGMNSKTNVQNINIPNSALELDKDETFDILKTLIATYATGLIAKKWYDSEEEHHIVARKAPRAWISRLILDFKDVNIDIEDPLNKVNMKKGYHKVLHTKVYYKILNYSMITSYVINGRDGVVWLLNTYRTILGGL